MVPTFTTPEEFNSKTVIRKTDYKDYDTDVSSHKDTVSV